MIERKNSINKSVKVCMFVRNYFTNDARVTREAKTLIEYGYQVWVIAVFNEKDPFLKQREQREGIRIIRISRQSFLYDLKFYSKKFFLLNGKKRYTKITHKSAAFTKILGCLFLVLYHLWMALVSLIRFFIRAFKYTVTKITQPYLKFFLSYSVITLKFIYQGLKINADIYHAHDLDALLAGYVCSRIKGTRLIYDSHEIATDRENLYAKPFWRLLEWLLIKRADKVIFTTYTRAKFSADKYHIPLPEVVSSYTDIPKTIPKKDLRSMLNIADNQRIALYQGGIQSGRGLDSLIDIVPKIREDVLVILIGDGKLKPTLEEKVVRLGLNNRVKFLGLVPLHDLLGYTACADVGLQILLNTCFNHYSTDSNKLFEYLAAGVPVVASNFPEIKKVVEEFDAGVLIDPHKPENIAEGINLVLADESRRKTMAENAKRASLKYNWKNEQVKLIKMYQDLYR